MRECRYNVYIYMYIYIHTHMYLSSIGVKVKPRCYFSTKNSWIWLFQLPALVGRLEGSWAIAVQSRGSLRVAIGDHWMRCFEGGKWSMKRLSSYQRTIWTIHMWEHLYIYIYEYTVDIYSIYIHHILQVHCRYIQILFLMDKEWTGYHFEFT